MNRDRRQRRQTEVSPLLISLLVQLYQRLEQSSYKPPVTIALLAVNIVVHIHPSPYVLGHYLDDIRSNCLQPNLIFSAFQRDNAILWHRLFFSSIIHADDMHLYGNMLSLCWKGLNLEKKFGSKQFFVLVCFSLVTSHLLMAAMAYVLYYYVGLDGHTSGYNTCAVGFSAVLYSLKYVWNQLSPENTVVMGFQVPSRYAAWLELVLTSIVMPQASFIGHLAGIFAGYLYLVAFERRSVISALPLPAFVTRFVAHILGMGRNSSRYTYHSGRMAEEDVGVEEDELEVGDEIELEYVEESKPPTAAGSYATTHRNSRTNDSNPTHSHTHSQRSSSSHTQATDRNNTSISTAEVRQRRAQRFDDSSSSAPPVSASVSGAANGRSASTSRYHI